MDDDPDGIRNNVFIDRHKIKKHLSGFGRIIQYFNPHPKETLNFNKPDQNYLWSVYEGQISEGIGHGFARIIYAETGKSYMGYYEKGNKNGKGI